MANTNKTKAEILQELESIKGLLLEEDDIPILQETEFVPEELAERKHAIPTPASPYTTHESVLPGQGSLFGDSTHSTSLIQNNQPAYATTLPTTTENETKRHGFAAHLNTSSHQQHNARPLAKATGENPFLPQHIRERLHGNNPPPLFEYETAKKIISATKNIPQKTYQPRQHLIDDVIKSLMPQIESELRHRLFAMSVEDLEKLLNEEED